MLDTYQLKLELKVGSGPAIGKQLQGYEEALAADVNLQRLVGDIDEQMAALNF